MELIEHRARINFFESENTHGLVTFFVMFENSKIKHETISLQRSTVSEPSGRNKARTGERGSGDEDSTQRLTVLVQD